MCHPVVKLKLFTNNNITQNNYFLNFRESNDRIARLEKEKSESAKKEPAPQFTNQPTPTPVPSGLQPKGLQFSTPTSTGRRTRKAKNMTPQTPQTPETPQSSSDRISDVESLSSNDTSCTPQMDKLSLGKGRGRPRKELKAPTMDDFPYDGTEEERTRYIKAKTSEMWRFKKKIGDPAAYRKSELNRVNAYNKKKKAAKAASVPSESESQEEETDRKKKLSRER